MALVKTGHGNYRHFQVLPERNYSRVRQRDKAEGCMSYEIRKTQNKNKKEKERKKLNPVRILDFRF